MAASSTTESLKAFYGPKTAELYGDIMKDEMAKIEPNLDKFLEGLPVGPILDTSCGTGDMLAYVHSKGRAELFGVDISEDMLAKARVRCPEAGMAQGTMQALPEWKDGSCAGLICAFAIHHLAEADAAEAVKEWARVLVAPGGRLYLGAWEGTGDMSDFGEGSEGLVLRRYPLAKLKGWCEAAGLSVSLARQEDDEMGSTALIFAERLASA